MTSHEYDQGYRDQAAWLRKQAPSLPGAEHCLGQRQATHDGGEYNQGGDQARRLHRADPPASRGHGGSRR